MSGITLPAHRHDKEGPNRAKARVKRSRLARALRGFRRLDVTIGPEATVALESTRRRLNCSIKEAIETALILQAKTLKKR